MQATYNRKQIQNIVVNIIVLITRGNIPDTQVRFMVIADLGIYKWNISSVAEVEDLNSK